MAYKTLLLILGDNLFSNHNELKPGEDSLFFMAEDYGLCTHFKYHKQKLLFFLSSMRSHRDEVLSDYNFEYYELTEENKSKSYFDKLKSTLENHSSIDKIKCYEINDHFFKDELVSFCKENNYKLETIKSKNFILDKNEFKEYLKEKKNPFLHTFYSRERKKRDILMDNGEPVGGKWSFDDENRKKLPKHISIPNEYNPEETQHTKELKPIIKSMFKNHPGTIDNFNWATTRDQAFYALDKFLDERFEDFGPYEDAIHSEETFIFHSVLSPYINSGLLTPEEVLTKALKKYEEENTHFPSVEGFVRQILGWREFMKGMYDNFDMEKNFFNNKRKMKDCWYDGTTGLEPLDDSIKKAEKYAYTHHIERLMVLGNIMLLCEIHPNEVYKWFMEMYIDSADWVMVPNVYGMSQYADGGIFATKPYIGGGNYIAKMSNYSKSADWAGTVTGLYWRFISEHLDVFAKNQRMSMMVATLKRMNKEKMNRYLELSNDFIEKVTYV